MGRTGKDGGMRGKVIGGEGKNRRMGKKGENGKVRIDGMGP